MTIPGQRARIAALIAAWMAKPLAPITPMPSPCEAGFLRKRQAG